eukprot:771040-Ditylum_brightwellii.AAC.1
MEDGTTINSFTDAQVGSEMRESMDDLNSQVSSVTYNSVETEHSIIAHETKEQILELAVKDALYDGDGGTLILTAMRMICITAESLKKTRLQLEKGGGGALKILFGMAHQER